MNYFVALILAVFLHIQVTPSGATEWRIKCSNGFDTGWNHKAYFANSKRFLFWQETKYANYNKKSMPKDATCKRSRR